MSNWLEIPLKPRQQTFQTTLGSTPVTLTALWSDDPLGGWYLNIDDVNGNPVLYGLPLVTGTDLLAQYQYLGFGVGLYVQTDGSSDSTPTFANLGSTSHLYVLSPQ